MASTDPSPGHWTCQSASTVESGPQALVSLDPENNPYPTYIGGGWLTRGVIPSAHKMWSPSVFSAPFQLSTQSRQEL